MVVYLISYAAVQRVRGTDEPLRSATRRFSADYAVSVGVRLHLWWLAESAPARLAAGLVVGIAYAAIGAVEPFIVELANETGELNPEERARIGIREDGIRIAILETERTKIASGLAVGILLGYRAIYPTSYLLSELAPEAVSAVVEHERAHHRRHHLRLKVALVSGALAVAVALLTTNVGY